MHDGERQRFCFESEIRRDGKKPLFAFNKPGFSSYAGDKRHFVDSPQRRVGCGVGKPHPCVVVVQRAEIRPRVLRKGNTGDIAEVTAAKVFCRPFLIQLKLQRHCPFSPRLAGPDDQLCARYVSRRRENTPSEVEPPRLKINFVGVNRRVEHLVAANVDYKVAPAGDEWGNPNAVNFDCFNCA